MIVSFFLLLFTLSMMPTPSIGAERVWDKDLKRYLTDQEMSMAEVYLREEDGIKIMFSKSEQIREEVIRLGSEKSPSSKNESVGNFRKNLSMSISEKPERRSTAMRSYITQSANINHDLHGWDR